MSQYSDRFSDLQKRVDSGNYEWGRDLSSQTERPNGVEVPPSCAMPVPLARGILRNPTATIPVLIEDDGFADAGIYRGSVALADTEVEPKPGDVVLIVPNEDERAICYWNPLYADRCIGVVVKTINDVVRDKRWG
jgi:hypothetical protein